MSSYPNYGAIRKEHTEAAASALISAVASSDFDGKMFAAYIGNEHRTNQQSLMRAIAYVLDGWANQPSDGRNQATVQFATEVKPILDKYVFPYI